MTITHGIVTEEDMAPFVFDKEKTIDEDEEHGEDYDDHDEQATVQLSYPNTAILIITCRYLVKITQNI